jgi:hypothetical protein
VLSLAKRGVHSIFTYNSNRAEAEKVVTLAQQAGANDGRSASGHLLQVFGIPSALRYDL